MIQKSSAEMFTDFVAEVLTNVGDYESILFTACEKEKSSLKSVIYGDKSLALYNGLMSTLRGMVETGMLPEEVFARVLVNVHIGIIQAYDGDYDRVPDFVSAFFGGDFEVLGQMVLENNGGQLVAQYVMGEMDASEFARNLAELKDEHDSFMTTVAK